MRRDYSLQLGRRGEFTTEDTENAEIGKERRGPTLRKMLEGQATQFKSTARNGCATRSYLEEGEVDDWLAAACSSSREKRLPLG